VPFPFFRRSLPALLAGGAFLVASCGATRTIEVPAGHISPEGLDLVGRPVPSFSAVTLDGATLSPDQARGKVLIIQLWGVNCGSCLEEMAFFDSSLYPSLKGKGLEIWGVNADQVNEKILRPEMDRVKAKAGYPLLADPKGKVSGLFTTWFIPVTVIVDTQGIVKYYKVGFSPADQEKVRAQVESLLPQE